LILRSLVEGRGQSPLNPVVPSEPAKTGFTAPAAATTNHKVHARQGAPSPLGKVPAASDAPITRTAAGGPRVDQAGSPESLIKPRPATGRLGEVRRKR
jgi:hypothetical protein